jgi:hypothetical protein
MSDKLVEKLRSYLGDKPDYEKLDILFNENGFDIDFIKQIYPYLIKTFRDLEFKLHPNSHGLYDKGVLATLNFDNGHWISVIGGAMGMYGDGVNTFEIGYPVSENDMDVMPYMSPEKITEEIFKIQIRKPFKNEYKKERIPTEINVHQ